METYQVNILNPKAIKLLEGLAELNLISIQPDPTKGFQKLIDQLRSEAESDAPSMEEITKEVETVRAARYARNTEQDHP